MRTDLVESVVAEFVRGFDVETNCVVGAEYLLHGVSDRHENVIMPCAKCACKGDPGILEQREVWDGGWMVFWLWRVPRLGDLCFVVLQVLGRI